MIFLFFKILLLLPFSFAAESIKSDHVFIDWLVPENFSVQEETLIGIRFSPDPHWHVYWKNPGDSGAAPKFKINIVNAEASSILWPYPARLPVAHLTNLGYEGETVYFFKVTPKSQGVVKIDAELEWLVCQEECIPGFGTLNLERPAQNKPVQFKKSIEEKLKSFEKKLPSDGKNSPYHISLSETSDGFIKATITSQVATLPNEIDLFPIDLEYVLPAQPQVSKTESGFEIVFQKSNSSAKPSALGFLLVADEAAYEFTNLELIAISSNAEPTNFSVLLLLLTSSLLGGILLNLMPCVFPVISIKAVSLLKIENSKERIRDGLLYTLGVLTTFAALGVIFLILRSLGSAVGWGFQLQSPMVVFLLILLFWIMALNFLGAFEFGTSIMNTAGKLGGTSSFGTGVLSVFVAAPCTGPFMGTALGAAATMPSYQAILIFITLGLGLAIPYLVLTMSHRLAKRLPRPGAWMETLKQFFAFPLFATVLWLLWVLGLQTGSEGWIASSIALLGISFALWLGQRKKKFWTYMAWVLTILVLVYSGQQIQKANVPASKDDWQNYSEEKLNSALQKGQPVFVDFTAAWCITCQVNKKVVLETDAASEIFKKENILKLRADWTKQDPLITQALAKLKRNSVPVYAFYSGKEPTPRLLPQILTIDMIQKLIPSKEEK